MASLRVQVRRRKMTMGVSMFHSSVHSIWHVSQINKVIYVDGATRTATAKVTPFTSQHASELNARLIQHRGGRRNPPSPNVSCAFRPWPLLAGAHTLAKPHIPEEALITNSAPPTRWPLIISVYSSPSEQPLLHLSYASRCRLHRCPACNGSSISGPSLLSDNLLPGISA